MKTAIVVLGKLADPTHIELEEPVTAVEGRVEVVLQAIGAERSTRRNVFDLVAGLAPGSRSKEEIDHHLAISSKRRTLFTRR